MAENKALADLKKCITACSGNTTCMDKCETTFMKAGGTVSMTIDGGKVFTAPDGTMIVVTGGKVF
jgi:hypothetical protein